MSTLVAPRDGGLREPRPRVLHTPIGPETRHYPDAARNRGQIIERTGEAFVVPWQLPELAENER